MPPAPIELVFLATGVAVAFLAFLYGSTRTLCTACVRNSGCETFLTAAALLLAVIVLGVLPLALAPGMPDLVILRGWVLLPALIVLSLVGIAAHYLALHRLANCMTTGLWVGAAATAFLDAVRLVGFELELLPRNMPRVFGCLLVGAERMPPTLTTDLIGCLFQYGVGACAGVIYTVLVGASRWWGGLVYALFLGAILLVTSGTIVAWDVGYYARHWGLTTGLVAYGVFGVVLGLLAERHVKHEGLLRLAVGVSGAETVRRATVTDIRVWRTKHPERRGRPKERRIRKTEGAEWG